MPAPVVAAPVVEAAAAQAQVVTPSPGPVDTAKLAVARQIIAAAYPQSYQTKLFGPVLQQLMARIRAGMQLPPGLNDPGLHKIMDDLLVSMPEQMRPVMERNYPIMMDAYAHAYAREFSSEELAAILAFVETPAGRHYFGKSGEMMADPDVGNAMTGLIRDAQVIARQASLAMQQQLKDYLIKHPDVAMRFRAVMEAAQPSRAAN